MGAGKQSTPDVPLNYNLATSPSLTSGSFPHIFTPILPHFPPPQIPLNYNLASEYFPDLGFFVAVDGAMRLDRQLPSAALLTFAPPGSFYLDNPVGGL